MRRLRREECGTAVVEFAVVAVLFIGLIMSGITYGMIFWAKHTMTHAASEGARAALTVAPGDEAAAEAAAAAKAEGAVVASLGDRADHVTIDTGVADCDGGSQRCITVTVTYPYEEHPIVAPVPFLPFVPEELVSTSVVELNPKF
jgi:Flp pilus assembly protein TadG